MFDLISLQSAPNIMEKKKMLHNSRQKKECGVIYNQQNVFMVQSISFSSLLINLLSFKFLIKIFF